MIDMSRKIEYIIIHCSATKPSMDIGAKEIKRWHVEDNGWSDIGYHLVIKRDGTIEFGRHPETVGAHARNYNSNSIGICYVGGVDEDRNPEDNRTECQKESLLQAIKFYKLAYPSAEVIGHCDISGKDCPSFNAKEEYKDV